MATKKEDTANSEEDSSIDNTKIKKIAKKLKAMGVMGLRNKTAETSSNKMMTMMLALIVAIPAGAIVAYITMPGQLNEFLSLPNELENKESNNFQAHQQIPAYPSARSLNRVQESESEWLTQRRAEIAKRRSEFEKYNTNHYAANRNPSEPPQWVKDRLAQMEQRRAEFEKQNTDNYVASGNLAEPPQWVKDQQALMQKNREKYQQQWANMSYNRAVNQPSYMANPRMNAHQPQPNQAPVTAYAQPVNPYYYNNAPYSGPHRMSYGQYGYPYR